MKTINLRDFYAALYNHDALYDVPESPGTRDSGNGAFPFDPKAATADIPALCPGDELFANSKSGGRLRKFGKAVG